MDLKSPTNADWPDPKSPWYPEVRQSWRLKAWWAGRTDGWRGIGATLPDGTPANETLYISTSVPTGGTGDGEVGGLGAATSAGVLGLDAVGEPQAGLDPRVSTMYFGRANVYLHPPFVSRLMDVGIAALGTVGVEFLEKNERYESIKRSARERFWEAYRGIGVAKQDLEVAESAEAPEDENVSQAESAARDSVRLAQGLGEAVEVNTAAEASLRARAGARAAAATRERNSARAAAHAAKISEAQAYLTGYREQLDDAAAVYVEARASQLQWYNFNRTRAEVLEGLVRAIVDVYWSSNRRARRSWWRRAAQALFGRWATGPFVIDPITVSPPIPEPAWIRDYAHLSSAESDSDPISLYRWGKPLPADEHPETAPRFDISVAGSKSSNDEQVAPAAGANLKRDNEGSVRQRLDEGVGN